MGEDHYPRNRSSFRGVCLSAGAILAAVATAALILSNDDRYHKAAVIAAVWAIVLALLASGRTRRDEDMPSEREAELRRTYELEIDREVAARREYELRLEVSLRRELENSLQHDLSEVRAQLGSLRKEMAEHWNGELRLERFALRAESTRLTGGDRQVLEQQAGRIGLESSENGGRTLEAVNYRSGPAPVDGGTTSLPSLLGQVSAPESGNEASAPRPAAGPRPSPTPRPVPAASAEPARRADTGGGQDRPAAANETGGPDPLFGPMPLGGSTGSWPRSSGFNGPNLAGANSAGVSSSTGSWPSFGSTNNWAGQAGGYVPLNSGTGRYRALGSGTGRYALPSGTGRYRALGPGTTSGPQVPWPADPSLTSGPTVAAGGASAGGGNQSSGSQSDGFAPGPTGADPARGGRRHRRAAESEQPPAQQNSAELYAGNQPGWGPEATGANDSAAGRRRRRYRDDDEDNDVLSRMRQQR